MRQLVEQLAITAELMGQQLSPVAVTSMAQDLSQYPIDVVISALTNLRRQSKGRMTLAAIIEQVERLQSDGRPGADEAWAMIPKDEYGSCVWTTEMQEAWGIALPLLKDGDKISARMAFKDAYTRITDTNKAQGIAPVWEPSLGDDKEGREFVLKEAERLGRLRHGHVAGLLPMPPATGAVAALLSLPSAAPMTDAEREAGRGHLTRLKDIIGGRKAV